MLVPDTCPCILAIVSSSASLIEGCLNLAALCCGGVLLCTSPAMYRPLPSALCVVLLQNFEAPVVIAIEPASAFAFL